MAETIPSFIDWSQETLEELRSYTPPRAHTSFMQEFIGQWDEIPPEILEYQERMRRQLSDTTAARIDEMMRETLLTGATTTTIGVDTAIGNSTTSYADIRAYHRQLSDIETKEIKNKETYMTQHLKFKQTTPLEEIIRRTNMGDRDAVTYAYENDIEFYTERDISREDFQHPEGISPFFEYEDSEGRARSFHCRLEYIVQTQQELLEGMEWSSLRTSYINFGQNHLLEQIRNRYAFFDRPVSGLSNIIIDNYAPKLMYLTHLNQWSLRRSITLPKTIYTISPWFAQYFGAQLVPTEQLCRIIGYDVKTLKNLITKVKRKNYTVSFVGYGGTVVNTIHWLTEIMKVTQSVNLFKCMEIFEPDTLEISNLLRFPKNPYIENTVVSTGSQASKLRLLANDEVSILSRTTPHFYSSRIDGNNLRRSTLGVVYDHEARDYIIKDNHVFYGAPNIDTRASFEGKGHFISATHNGNDAHLWLNPTQDSDLQVESYGLIQLTPFFMNQLRLAIGFLETLALDDLDLKGPERLLLEYSFDGEAKLSTNRTYNFQLGNHNGNVTTEEEAANAW